MVAFDLDGTALDDEKYLPEENRKALAACVERGILIVPCTGRLAIGIPQEILDIGVRYAVTVNGSTIEDLQEGWVLDRQLLEKETALEIVTMAQRQPRVMCDVYADCRGFSEPRYYDHLEEFGISPVIAKMLRETRTKIDSVTEYIRRPGTEVNKINMYFSDMEERKQMMERLKRQFPGVLVTTSIMNNLEINSAGASKGPALGRLASMLGIGLDEVIAFGDGGNDYSLIGTAGTGVAMANAEEGLKEIADYVTGSNNDAGLAAAIRKFILSV